MAATLTNVEFAALPPLHADDEPFEGVQHRCYCACSRDPARPCGALGWRAGEDCAWCRAVQDAREDRCRAVVVG